MLKQENNKQEPTHNPYAVLEKTINDLKDPVAELLRKHDDLVAQNLSIMSNLASVPKLDQDLKTRMKKE